MKAGVSADQIKKAVSAGRTTAARTARARVRTEPRGVARGPESDANGPRNFASTVRGSVYEGRVAVSWSRRHLHEWPSSTGYPQCGHVMILVVRGAMP